MLDNFNISSFPFLFLEYGFLFFCFLSFFVGLLFSPIANSSRFAWLLNFIISASFLINYSITIVCDMDLLCLGYYDSGLISLYNLQVLKILALFCLILLCTIGIFITKNKFTLEFISLLMFSQACSLFLLSTDHLLIVILFLETQALIGYILTVYKRSSVFATEAGMKYFLLGGVSSSILLLGVTLLYSSVGSFYLNDISAYYSYNYLSLDYIFSSVHILGGSLVIFGFFFKLSAAPFHFWTPDVYEDVEYLTIGYFSTIPKLSVIGLLIGSFYFLISSLSYLFLVVGLFSLAVGTLNGIYQINLKRLLAYSTITNTSYILLIFAVDNIFHLSHLITISVYFQFIIYSISILLFIAIAQSLPYSTSYVHDLNIFYFAPITLKISCILSIFSLAGIPPLLGFFSKVVILYTITYSSALFFLSILIPLFSLLSQFYYTRVVASFLFKNKTTLTTTTNLSFPPFYSFLIFFLGIVLNLFSSLLIYLI